MRRKGAGAMMAALATITAIIVVGLASASISWFQDLDQTIRLKSVEVPEGRMESVIYAVDALDDDARVQLNFGAKYNISRRDGRKIITYQVPDGDESDSRILESPVDFTVAEGRSSKFCLIKSQDNPVEVVPREC